MGFYPEDAAPNMTSRTDPTAPLYRALTNHLLNRAFPCFQRRRFRNILYLILTSRSNLQSVTMSCVSTELFRVTEMHVGSPFQHGIETPRHPPPLPPSPTKKKQWQEPPIETFPELLPSRCFSLDTNSISYSMYAAMSGE